MIQGGQSIPFPGFWKKPVMAFWDVEVGYQRITDMLRKYISAITCEYSYEGPPVCQIQTQGPSFLEDAMTEGLPVRVYFGWEATKKALMIDGIIATPADGTISGIHSYTLTVADNATKMAKKAINHTFPVPKKREIIHSIVSSYNYESIVDIDDSLTIPMREVPLQKNETDLSFIYRMAASWNCICWFEMHKGSRPKFYFVDSGKAHKYGDDNKAIRTVQDPFSEYQLGYRTDSGYPNNIEEITFKHKKPPGGTETEPGAFGSDESGAVVEPEDYDIKHEGTYYKLKDEIKKEISKNPAAGVKYFNIVAMADVSKSEDNLRQYFIPLKELRTERQKFIKDNDAKILEVSVKLKWGDPFLRSPRTAMLQAGSNAPTADVPAFLFRDGKPQKYFINKVQTVLTAKAFIDTTLEMTMGKFQ